MSQKTWWNIIFNKAPVIPDPPPPPPEEQRKEGVLPFLSSFTFIFICVCIVLVGVIILLCAVLFFRGCDPACENGGTCELSTCKCPEHYKGEGCEVGVPLNKGVWDPETKHAECLPRFSGKLCEIGRPFNGGFWVKKKNAADCPDGFSGQLCQIAHVCPKDFVELNVTDRVCYRLFSTPHTWLEADEACKDISNSRLLSMTKEDDITGAFWFMTTLSSNRSFNAWTSGNDLRKRGKFTWEHQNTRIQDKYWCSTLTSLLKNRQSCVEFSVSLLGPCLKDENCNATLPYFCEVRIQPE